MTAAELIERETADLRLIAQAMCSAEVLTGAAPCNCDLDPVRCCALEVYGHQARVVRKTLLDLGRITAEPVRLTPQLVESFFAENAARQRGEAAAR